MADVIVAEVKPVIKPLMRIINRAYPLTLFADGTDGFWGDSTDSYTLFQTTAGGTPSAPGDFCGTRVDKSGNSNDQYQTTTAAKPTVQIVDGVQALVLDDTDDAMLIDVPVGGWSGAFVQGTAQGVIVGEFAAPEGPYQIPTNPNFAGPGSDIHTVIVNRTLAAHELDELVEWVGQRCPVADFSGATSMNSWFRGRTDLTQVDASHWDTSSVTNMQAFALGCTSLTTLDVSNWNTSSVTDISFFAQGCTSLTTLDVSSWNTSSVTNIRQFAQNCYSLTTLDVSNWNTSQVTNMGSFAQNCNSLTTLTITGGTGSPFSDSPCTNYVSAFANTKLSQQSYTDLVTAIEAAGTSGGTLDITGGAATTTGAAQTAVDALRGRGWTVTTPDGY